MAAIEDHEALPKDIVPKNYAFTLTPDFGTFHFGGEETIDALVVHPTSTFVRFFIVDSNIL
jgi:hypothetical protein